MKLSSASGLHCVIVGQEYRDSRRRWYDFGDWDGSVDVAVFDV